eukprot:jgi/Mesvir1/20378/Mv12286-RA.1
MTSERGQMVNASGGPNDWDAKRQELEQMVAEAEMRLLESKRLRDEHVKRLLDAGSQTPIASGTMSAGDDAEERISLTDAAGEGAVYSASRAASPGVGRRAPNERASASLVHPECRACRARDPDHSPHPGAHFPRGYNRLGLGSSWWSGLHPLCHHSEGCLSHAFTRFCNGFVMAYAVRVGIGFLTHGLGVIRARPAAILKREELAVPHKKGLLFRADALRLGFFFGGFSGVFHALRCTMLRWRATDDGWNSFVAGTGAGLSLLALDGERRRTLALYLLARVAQSVYNSSKAQGRFHPLVSQYGDTFLFCLASAQIMYAYIMHPNSLPPSYWTFIVRTGPISKPVLKAVRENNMGLPIDVGALSAHCRELAGRSTPLTVLDSPYPSIVPCAIVHPATPHSCTIHNAKAMGATFRRTFPLYLSLNLVPFVILNIPKFVRNPASALGRGFLSATRSTSMIALFVGLYQVRARVALGGAVHGGDDSSKFFLLAALGEGHRQPCLSLVSREGCIQVVFLFIPVELPGARL